MRNERSTTRTPALAVTATTVVALMAMAATASACPMPRHAEFSERQAGEAHVVRAMAAAMAVAVRDLVIGDTCVSPAAMESWRPTVEVVGDCGGQLHPMAQSPRGRIHTVAERLLDLPPPRC